MHALIVEGDIIRDILSGTHFDEAEDGIRGLVVIKPRIVDQQGSVDGFTAELVDCPERRFSRTVGASLGGLPLTDGRVAEPLIFNSDSPPPTLTLEKIHAQAQVEPKKVPISFRPVVIAPR